MKHYNAIKFFLITIITLFTYETISARSTMVLNINKGAITTNEEIQQPVRHCEQLTNGIKVTYKFQDATLSKRNYNQKSGRFSITFPGFRESFGTGIPMLPTRADMYVVAETSKITLSIDNCDYIEYNMELAPAISPIEDGHHQVIETHEIKNYKGFYPSEPVYEDTPSFLHNLKILKIVIAPVQYDNENKTVRIYTSISYHIEVDTPDEFYQTIEQNQLECLYHLQRSGTTSLLNLNDKISKLLSLQPILTEQAIINDNYTHNGIVRSNDTYLIICTPTLRSTAKKLAEWKKAIGFNAIVDCKNVWTTSTITAEVQNFYSKPNKGTMYCLLFGDMNAIPAISKTATINNQSSPYLTDCPYFCLNGTDAIPEVKYARIPCNTLTEANIVVNKIINYEKNPPTVSSYYNTGINIATYQDWIDEDLLDPDAQDGDKPNGYEDVRHSETVYEVGKYLETYAAKNINKAYILDGSENNALDIWHWSKLFSYGMLVPNDVHISCFHHDYDADKFPLWLNSGAFYVLYRGHGSTTEFSGTGIGLGTFANASNGNKLPFCFDLCCYNGWNMGNTLPKTMLVNQNGGAIGCLACTSTSISNLNDGLAHGIFNALWPNPGITSDFRYTPDKYDGDVICNKYIPNSSSKTYEIFEAVQQGFFRSEQIFPTMTNENRLQRERYHIFGDPAQILYTTNPYSTQSKTNFSVTRNATQVSISYPFSQGVITIYDTKTNTVKSFIGASYVVYNCDDSEKVIVSVKYPGTVTQVNAGSSVNL